MKIDTELQRLELVSEPDSVELELRDKVQKFRDTPSEKPDLDVFYELASHCIDKNRPEESIDFLLEIIAIDRNWEQGKAHKLLTTLLKKLGSNNEVAKKARKTLSKLLF